MRLGRVYIWRLREFLCAPGNGAEARLVILGAILARESLAPSVASLFLSLSPPSGCMPRLAAHERDNPRVLDTAAAAIRPVLSVPLPLCRQCSPNPIPPRLQCRTSAQRSGACTHSVFTQMTYKTLYSRSTPTKKTRNLSLNQRTTLSLYVCVFACMPLRVYSFPFAHFTPRWPPPPRLPPSPAAQEVETSGANANETDLICAIICMTHIEEQGGKRRKEAAALVSV